MSASFSTNRRAFLACFLSAAFGPRSGAALAQASPTSAATPVTPLDPSTLAVFAQYATTAEGWPLQILIATPELLRLAGREREISTFGADNAMTVIAIREHNGALASGLDDGFSISVRVDGGEILLPSEHLIVRDDATTREDAFVYIGLSPAITTENHLLETLVPGPDPAAPVSIVWITPLVVPAASGTPEAFSPVSTPPPMVDVMETAIPAETFEAC